MNEEEIKKQQEELLKKIKTMVEDTIKASGKESVTKADVDKMVADLNKETAKLSDEAMKKLDLDLKEVSKKNGELQNALKEATDALKLQGDEIKKLTDKGLDKTDPEKPISLREAIKQAIMEKKDVVLKEVNDDYGKRLSMKEYLENNRQTPVFEIKAAINMYESLSLTTGVVNYRLTELDPQRVGIPLTIYPHVMDVMKVKNIRKPYMALLVVYEYFDGAATKAEGVASGKSSFKFKTVVFPAFFIATHFVLSDETLDDLDEALDEISIVAPDVIQDLIDTKVLGATGDDVTDLAGILTANKHTDFANALPADVADAYIVDVIASAKLQVQNNKYQPNVVYMNPGDVVLLAAKKNTFEDSQYDRRVQYDSLGNPVAACGLRIIVSTAIVANQLIVFDNKLTWIGKRRGMTMEIGYNGTDLTQGQKTVVIKIRIAFGVRDKAGIVHVSDITAAIAAITGS